MATGEWIFETRRGIGRQIEAITDSGAGQSAHCFLSLFTQTLESLSISRLSYIPLNLFPIRIVRVQAEGLNDVGFADVEVVLAGLEAAGSGEILIDGERVNELPPQRRDVAMVFQSYALYPHMTVADNIGYPLRVRKLNREQISKQVAQTAALLEIETLLHRKPRELSGGERQRVALARAIVRSPRAFLMDEPLSNLDARLRVQMRGELKHLQHALGTTTVYVTHDQAEAMTLGHRVAVMNKGKLQQFETPLDIYNRPANRFVAEFVGSPGMNFFDGRLDTIKAMFEGDGVSLAVQNGLERVRGRTEPVTLGIRPEHIQVSDTQRENCLAARVYVTELMGSETFVFLAVGQRKIIARTPGDFRAEPESPVWIEFDTTKAHFFDPESGKRL